MAGFGDALIAVGVLIGVAWLVGAFFFVRKVLRGMPRK